MSDYSTLDGFNVAEPRRGRARPARLLRLPPVGRRGPRPAPLSRPRRAAEPVRARARRARLGRRRAGARRAPAHRGALGGRDAGGRLVAGRAGRAAGRGRPTTCVAGNVAYEERFGHVFLICATGLSGEEMLTALRSRLGNDPDHRAATWSARSCGKIVDLRLGKAFGMSLSTHVLDTSAGPAGRRRARAAGPARRRLAHDRDRAHRRRRPRSPAWRRAGSAGVYRLVFDTAIGGEFYPEVVVTFRITDAGRALPRATADQPVRLLDLPGELTMDDPAWATTSTARPRPGSCASTGATTGTRSPTSTSARRWPATSPRRT